MLLAELWKSGSNSSAASGGSDGSNSSKSSRKSSSSARCVCARCVCARGEDGSQHDDGVVAKHTHNQHTLPHTLSPVALLFSVAAGQVHPQTHTHRHTHTDSAPPIFPAETSISVSDGSNGCDALNDSRNSTTAQNTRVLFPAAHATSDHVWTSSCPMIPTHAAESGSDTEKHQTHPTNAPYVTSYHSLSDENSFYPSMTTPAAVAVPRVPTAQCSQSANSYSWDTNSACSALTSLGAERKTKLQLTATKPAIRGKGDYDLKNRADSTQRDDAERDSCCLKISKNTVVCTNAEGAAVTRVGGNATKQSRGGGGGGGGGKMRNMSAEHVESSDTSDDSSGVHAH